MIVVVGNGILIPFSSNAFLMLCLRSLKQTKPLATSFVTIVTLNSME